MSRAWSSPRTDPAPRPCRDPPATGGLFASGVKLAPILTPPGSRHPAPVGGLGAPDPRPWSTAPPIPATGGTGPRRPRQRPEPRNPRRSDPVDIPGWPPVLPPTGPRGSSVGQDTRETVSGKSAGLSSGGQLSTPRDTPTAAPLGCCHPAPRPRWGTSPRRRSRQLTASTVSARRNVAPRVIRGGPASGGIPPRTLGDRHLGWSYP